MTSNFRLAFARATAPGLLLATLLACGGSVAIDGDSTGGSTSVGVQNGAGGADTTVVASSTSTGVPATNCGLACASLQECGGGLDDCLAKCQAIEQGPCGELHQAWLDCAFGFTDTLCGTSGGILCEPQLRDYLTTCGPLVGETGCEENEDGCSCGVFVSPGVDFTQRCDAEGNCECLTGETSLGFCPGQNLTCDPIANCCAGLFYTSGY